MAEALIDPELAAAGAALRARGLLPVSPMTAPIAEARAAIDRISGFLGEDSVPIGGERDIAVPGPRGPVRCRFYPAAPGAALLVYAHGGSFAVGGLDAWDHVLRDLVRRSGVAALHVDYRMIPEHRFPAAPDDMLAVARWAATEGGSLGIDPSRIALGGDSAGANLALGAAMALRDSGGPQPRFLLLHYGAYSTDYDSPSWHRFGGGEYGLSRAAAAWLWESYLEHPGQRQDWRAAPLLAEMRGLPPALLTIGSHDPLWDEQQLLAARLAEAGVPCRLLAYPGLTHGFIRHARLVGQVRQAIAASAAALRAAFGDT
jgi:acetyl esterase